MELKRNKLDLTSKYRVLNGRTQYTLQVMHLVSPVQVS